MQPDLPHAWAVAFSAVLRTASCVLVLGPAEAGASTLCRMLLEHVHEDSRSATIGDPAHSHKFV